MPRRLLLCLAVLALMPATLAHAQEIHKKEPLAGLLSCGEIVLVDDRTCPRGQVSEVTGGCNSSGNVSSTGAGRSRRCVPRPKR